MDMQIVCRFCIYVSQHACWDQPLYLHTHIQEHRLAPSAFKGKYLYCVLSCLLWVVYVSQVSLMSVPISLSLCHSHRSFCELWGGTAKSVHVVCSILVCDCVSYQDPTLRKAGISHHACCRNQSVQFITLHVISVRAGAECACHCYAGGAACGGWHGNWEVVQKTALCQHRPRQSRGRTSGERTHSGEARSPLLSPLAHAWRDEAPVATRAGRHYCHDVHQPSPLKRLSRQRARHGASGSPQPRCRQDSPAPPQPPGAGWGWDRGRPRRFTPGQGGGKAATPPAGLSHRGAEALPPPHEAASPASASSPPRTDGRAAQSLVRRRCHRLSHRLSAAGGAAPSPAPRRAPRQWAASTCRGGERGPGGPAPISYIRATAAGARPERAGASGEAGRGGRASPSRDGDSGLGRRGEDRAGRAGVRFRPFLVEARRAAGQLLVFPPSPLEASGLRRAVITLRGGGSEPGEANGEAAWPPGRGPSPHTHPPSPRTPSRAPEATAAAGPAPLLSSPPGAA